MKVAISVPEPVFDAAERLSRRMRISRSQLYSRAVEAWVREHGGEDVTERLDAVYREQPSTLDAEQEGATLEVLRRERW
jgi:hypothetical protein